MPAAQNIHVSPSSIVNAGRIFKQTLSVARSELFSSVIICGEARDGLPRHEQLTGGRLIERIGAAVDDRPASVLGRAHEQVSWSLAVYGRYAKTDTSVVNAHALAVLPVCYLLSRRLGAKLIYDTHELETETYVSRGVQRRLFKIIERWIIGKCDAVFVVNQSIADWYREQYHGVNPVVIRNIPRIESGRPAVDTRKILSIPPDKPLFVHVGSLTEGRNIHTILETFASDEVDAHVLFLGDGQFEAAVCDYRRKHSNIHWLPPVSPAEVVSYVAGCDVGLCLSEASCLSYKLSLGNKALEYIKAGLPFFFTDLPEVHRLLGPALSNWCIKDPASCLASAITDLTASKIDQAAADIAKVRLPTWDEEAATMIAAYTGLISGAGMPANR